MKQRNKSDRRSDDRRINSITVDVENRNFQRRSGLDRREVLAAQV